MEICLQVGLSGRDGTTLFREIATTPMFMKSLPRYLRIDTKEPRITQAWQDQCVQQTTIEMFAHWDDDEFVYKTWLSYDPGVPLVRASFPILLTGQDSILDLLSSISFELASFSSPHDYDWTKRQLEHYGFSAGHFSHGWACAFKGVGHNRLVSRRWLDFGPWRVLRGPHDTTLVQFHELGIDSETAFAQAHPGHKRMGISRTGGFLQTDFVYSQEYDGYYDRERRVLKILITAADTLTQGQMLDACAIRYYRAGELAPPLTNVAFVFIEPEAAYANLHELWLRELECWTFVKGKETRIDLDYHPTPDKPEWVRRLEAAGEQSHRR